MWNLTLNCHRDIAKNELWTLFLSIMSCHCEYEKVLQKSDVDMIADVIARGKAKKNERRVASWFLVHLEK